MDDAIKALAFGTASATGQEFLQALVRQLSATLKAPYVFVTEWVPGRTDRIRTVAGWCVDRAADPIEYQLPVTPCPKVLQDGEAFFPRGVQQLFPQDKYLAAHGIESYMGVCLLNRIGRSTGHLCIMDVRPFLFDSSQGSAIIKVFAERAASELERLRSEKARRASEAQLDRFVAEAPVGLVIFDADRRVIRANKTFCELTGYAEHEVLGNTYVLYTHPDDLPATLTLTDQFYLGERADYTHEKRYIRKSGKIIWVSVKATRVELPGHPGPLQLVAVQDITEQKLVMDVLHHKNRNLETLLYVTSHDLREPLRSIENFSHLVRDQYAERLDDKGKDFLRRVVGGAQRMDRLIADILALSRVQRMEPPAEDVEGASLVQAALLQLEGKIKKMGAQVRVANDFPRLRVHKILGTQAISNLIANALKFTSNGHAPDIEVASYQPGDGELAPGIVVRDRGPGVAPEHTERIFQLFQRAVGREVEGTGAGLAIVQRVTERHGGQAWVQPREGGGSEFFITFGAAHTSERNTP